MKKILIIDDEEGFRFFVKTNLELRGDYEVIAASGGEEGIRLAEEHKPDLVLLDILMPGIDGLETLNRLKENKNTKSIPVIMLTAKSDDETRIKALYLRNDGYVIKPFEIAALEEKIEEVLYKNGPQAA